MIRCRVIRSMRGVQYSRMSFTVASSICLFETVGVLRSHLVVSCFHLFALLFLS